MKGARRWRLPLGLACGALFFGFVAPFVILYWTLARAFGGGGGPSAAWGGAVFVVLLAVVGWRGRRDGAGSFFRGVLFGGLMGALGAAGVVAAARHRSSAVRIERARVVFSSGSPLESLQISETGGPALWRIAPLRDARTVNDVRYGAVPEGYRQEFPPIGSPRAFRPGELLTVDAVTVSEIERRTGTASGPDGIAVTTQKKAGRHTESPG